MLFRVEANDLLPFYPGIPEVGSSYASFSKNAGSRFGNPRRVALATKGVWRPGILSKARKNPFDEGGGEHSLRVNC